VIVATAALGMTLVIVSGGIDLSVGSAVALTSVVGALALDRGHSAFTAAAATIAVGAIIGAINGTVIGAFRFAPIYRHARHDGHSPRTRGKCFREAKPSIHRRNALNQLMATSNPNAIVSVADGSVANGAVSSGHASRHAQPPFLADIFLRLAQTKPPPD